MSKTGAILDSLGGSIEESLGKRTRTAPKLTEVKQGADPYQGRARARDAALITIDRILVDSQYRKHFDEGELKELAESIRSLGLIEPIIVRWDAARDGYVIIAGERRFRAAKLAGLKQLRCDVKPEGISDEEVAEIQLAENCARKDLNPIERALAYHDLMARKQCTARELAKRVGVNETTVTRHLRLLKLPPDIQQAVAAGKLSMGVAREAARLKDDTSQREFLAKAVDEGFTAAEAASRVAKRSKRASSASSNARRAKLAFDTNHGRVSVSASKDASYHDVEAALNQALQEVRHRIANNVRLY